MHVTDMMAARLRTGGLAIAIAWLLTGCTSVAPMKSAVDVTFDENAALAAVNALRAENGVSALTLEPRLTAAAEMQSAAMAGRDRMDHFVDGALPSRVKRLGYRFSTTSENIARGQPNFDAAMTAWEVSPGHRRNLLDPRVRDIGFGAKRETAAGQIFWTQIFGRQKDVQPVRILTVAGLPVPSQ